MARYVTQARYAINLREWILATYATDLKTTAKYPLGFRRAYAAHLGCKFTKRFNRDIDNALALIKRANYFTIGDVT
jgi:hypothetical protein